LWESPSNFPWDILGYPIPKFGPIHAYVIEMMAPFQDVNVKPFLLGRPSLSELKRFNNQANIQWIARLIIFCETNPDPKTFERLSTAEYVLVFLRREAAFYTHVQNMIESKWRRGDIIVPTSMIKD
jgi:hypothetical protein